MNNTIPFHSAPHAPQITVDVNILSMLKQAASCLTEMASENVYLAAIGPDMELTIIMEEDAPSVLPCFDEGDDLISVKGAPMFISYNPAQVLNLAGKRYLTGPVIFYRTDAPAPSEPVFPQKENEPLKVDRQQILEIANNRYHAKQLADGAAMLCEVSGAVNAMIRRWESVFRDYPDILTNTENRNAVKRNIQKVKDYLQKLEDTL